MALLISLKNDPKQIPQAFRQIELWANSVKLVQFTLAPPWAAVGGVFAPPGYIIEPTGWISLVGWLQYTGTLTTGVPANILNPLPTALQVGANFRQTFPVVVSDPAAGTIYPAAVEVSTLLEVVSNTTAVNPRVSLSGIRYYPRIPT